MATPPTNQPRSSDESAPAEAAGAYRQPQSKSSNPLPWILGLLALIAAIVLIAWAVGLFDDEDDDRDELEPGETLPGTSYIVPATPAHAQPFRLIVG